ncbi:hypothetical protein QYE76_058678 [Lolium multiflorum]|uniref:Uncharacterized protein n=1 Tax=Lolium multiflorum TaxID=4521 RepID=A0AAD8T6Q4_LOLMU|nr:hypothetical protein QYE76_058678 [Lolium multiflorum]
MHQWKSDLASSLSQGFPGGRAESGEGDGGSTREWWVAARMSSERLPKLLSPEPDLCSATDLGESSSIRRWLRQIYARPSWFSYAAATSTCYYFLLIELKIKMDRAERLYIDGIDDAPRKLLDLLLQLEYSHEAKSFFLAGWYGAEGVGASAVLRATAELLKSGRSHPDISENFGKIIHVNYSLCKNRRAMQRAIAKELNLGHLMTMFDDQDEDDDFRGIEVSSRKEIESIGSEIYAFLRNERFLMIFHYEGEEHIDLAECGIPDPEFGVYATGKLLWSGYGGFQLLERNGGLKSNSAYFKIITIYAGNVDTDQLLHHLLQKEAAEVIDYTGMDDINPAIVLDCFLYSLFLGEQGRWKTIDVDYEWDTHACNYWICDGILQGHKAYEVGNALYSVIQMVRYLPKPTSHMLMYFDAHRKRYERWISIPIKQHGAQDISTLPINTSSYFLTFGGDGQLQLTNDMFQLASNLHVLKLYKCSFDFASPPFRCFHNLRFLWLGHCTNTGDDQAGGPCFPNMLVLDIRFTDFPLLPETIELMTNLREVNTKGVSWRTVSHAWKKLKNLHKLRVTESSDVITVDNCSSINMMNLELLDLSGNIHMESLPTMSSAGNLKMLVLDGCSSLEHVALEGAPPLLESFSFDGYGQAKRWTHPIQLPKVELRPKSRTRLVQEAKVRRISLKGCARLRNIFLRGLPNLEDLDLSGTTIQALDLSAMDVPGLKKIFLVGCEQLKRLSWSGTNSRSLGVIHVDTRRNTRSVFDREEQMSSQVLMAFTDGRFIWSFIHILYWCTRCISKIHIHISSTIQAQVNITKGIMAIVPSLEGLVPTRPFLPYKDIVLNKDIVALSSLVWDHRQLYPLGGHLEIGEGSHHLDNLDKNEDSRSFINSMVESLHVHDSISITTILPGVTRYWVKLKWCHVERCCKLHTVFPSWGGYQSFGSLRIFSASDLPVVYCIWGTCTNYSWTSFRELQHIYLHNCPRLEIVLPISFTLPNLESIQIAYCANLQHIFRLNDKCPQKIASGVTFEKLKYIKLHYVHKLEQICMTKLTVPKLEMISLRDCWALRRLPALSHQGPKPVVDCEKDWWDRLEWDGSDANHDPSLFETRHSAHYKKTLPRVSVLR